MKQLLALILSLLLLSGCVMDPAARVTPTPEPTPTPTAVPTPTPTPTPEPTPTPPPAPTVATLAVCGDIIPHNPVIRNAWQEDRQCYDFTPQIECTRSYIQGADYAVANLETTLASKNYSGYPNFKAPDELAYDLKAFGFDLVLTANNHCMDAGFSGLSHTLDVLDEAGLAHVGTSRTQAEADSDMVVADIGGISVVFLGYTYGTNGYRLKSDAPWSVNLFNTDYLTTICTPDYDRLAADMAKARELGTDLIAVMIHWGNEYKLKENSHQTKMADFLISQGADLILGGHSHVPQPMELRTATDEAGNEHTAFVCYSLGNYISNQNNTRVAPYTDITAVLTVELTRDNVTGQSAVSGWSYAPMFMMNLTGISQEEYRLMDAREEVDDPQVQKLLQGAIDGCHQVFGAEHDEAVLVSAPQ